MIEILKVDSVKGQLIGVIGGNSMQAHLKNTIRCSNRTQTGREIEQLPECWVLTSIEVLHSSLADRYLTASSYS